MSVVRQNPDGSWSPAEPMPYQAGLDVEVHRDGQWEMYDGAQLVAHGTALTKLGLAFAVGRARRRFLRRRAR